MRSLQTIFRRALKVSMVAPVALAGCGPDVIGYSAPACDNGQFSVRDLSPSVIPDVVELRTVYRYGNSTPDQVNVISTSGTVCATATQPQTCKSTFAALVPSSGFGDGCLQICSDMHLATTRGDELKTWSSIEALREFLGVIDTGQEASLLALAKGYNLSCTDLARGAFKKVKTGWEVIATTGIACGKGSKVVRHYLSVSSAGAVTELRNEVAEVGADNCAIGRRPNGLVSRASTRCDDQLGQFFCEIAHLEAASVTAFDQLADELESARAPRSLVAAARRSAHEEVNHAELTGALARRFGASTRAPRIEPRASRDLFELALDNASEGCVRETFGALLAHHQALTAEDEGIRAAMQTIAEDETRHAELSWQIDGWAREQLNAEQLLQIEQARRQALAALRASLENESIDEVIRTRAGMPGREVSLSLLASLQTQLFAPAA